MDLNHLLHTAQKAAQAAGMIMQDHFGQQHQITKKGYRDLVTESDIKAQKAITSIIRKAFPDHGFMTEEKDNSLPKDGPIIWIIDPIDGTTNYSRNLPAFCCSIAAVENTPPIAENNVLLGVILDPMRQEIFCSTRDDINISSEDLKVSQVNKIEDAQIGHDWNRESHLRRKTLHIVSQLTHDAESIRTLGSAALALAWVAAGRFDGYFNYSLNAWDMAAASLMINKAGGKISTISGHEVDFSTDQNLDCLASNGHLHHALLAYVPQDNF